MEILSISASRDLQIMPMADKKPAKCGCCTHGPQYKTETSEIVGQKEAFLQCVLQFAVGSTGDANGPVPLVLLLMHSQNYINEAIQNSQPETQEHWRRDKVT